MRNTFGFIFASTKVLNGPIDDGEWTDTEQDALGSRQATVVGTMAIEGRRPVRDGRAIGGLTMHTIARSVVVPPAVRDAVSCLSFMMGRSTPTAYPDAGGIVQRVKT
jgi:hypothetical protein